MMMMIVFRSLLFVLLANTLFADNPWMFPRSASFHHALELFHSRVNNPRPSFSFSLSSLASLTGNGTICRDDLVVLMNGIFHREKWALKIIDSWGIKPPAGILEGSHLWLGSFDECLHSLYLPNNQSYAPQPYATKYCTLSSSTTDDDDNVLLQKPSLIIGICLPLSCQTKDFQMKSVAIQCPSEQRHLSIGALFTFSLIILLSLFVFSAAFIPYFHEYSAITTLKKILSLTTNHSTNYSFLNGIRILSLLWIILGHSFVFQLTIADNIVQILDSLHNSFFIQLLYGAVYAVDTFFFISGFLAVAVFVNTFKNQNAFHLQHLFAYYMHRYCRLIPTLVFVLLVSIHLTPWMGMGPIFPTSNGFEVPNCRHQWWATLLFINNIVSPATACLPVTWYIANDFQYHLLAPILLIPFILNRRRWTYILLGLILLINIITTTTIISTHPGFEAGFSENNMPSVDFFEQVYITPWCRIGAFIIGMMTKLMMEQYRPTLSSIKLILYTTLSIILAMTCIYFPFYSHSFPKFIHIIYQSISHQCWSIAIGWLIFVCSTNHGGLVNRILSWSCWTIVARLSYSAYLIHTIIILVQVYNRVSTIHYQTSLIFNNFLSQTILTLLASVLVVILVETPCNLLEKRIRRYYQEKKPVLTHQQTYGTLE